MASSMSLSFNFWMSSVGFLPQSLSNAFSSWRSSHTAHSAPEILCISGNLGGQIDIVVTGLCVVHFRITTFKKTNFLSLLFQPMDISFPCLCPYGHEMERTIFCSWEKRNVFSYWYSWLIPELWMISCQCLTVSLISYGHRQNKMKENVFL